MKRKCPNLSCSNPLYIVKDGRFKRKSDSRFIQRYRCKSCGKKFSNATHTLEVYQKKRRVNTPLLKLLSSGVSMRRAAIILGIHQITIARKLEYLAKRSRLKNSRLLKGRKCKTRKLQFDDLITKENSKLKPLSVSLAVDGEKRVILGAEVSIIPAFGHLSKIAKAKYGLRSCHHKKGLKRLFDSIQNLIDHKAEIRSDEHHKYPEFVKCYFPRARYLRFKSERGCIAGQGELKKVQYDPLFIINHTCAMLRANINRLIRKTWCTTKKISRLKDHLDIFIYFFNSSLLKEKPYLAPI